MKRVLAVAFASLLLALITGCGGGGSTTTRESGGGNGGPSTGPGSGGTGGNTGGGTLQSVNHIVILMQENRSFDHYLGKLNDYRTSQGLPQDVDGLPASVTLPAWKNAGTVSMVHMISMCSEDLSSSWQEAHADVNLSNPSNPGPNPPMNGFAAMAGGFSEHTGGTDVRGQRAVAYYDDGDLPFYYWAATQFATSDRWFSAALARTQPNRMYLLAATSQGYTFPPTNALSAKTIFELLENAGVSWRVYVTNGWAPGKTGGTYMNYFPNFTPKHVDKFAPATQFATDAQNGTLPEVSLIESGYESGQDEHPLNSVRTGAAYAESFVTALMSSPSWKDSVFFLTFDEGGGFYDHVPPAETVNPDGIKPRDLKPGDPSGDFTVTGFRVPLLVISPFARPHYVSHTAADFTAMLKFIETRFNLPSLNKRDAAQPDMTEYFDFAGAPNLGASLPLAQPVGGPCYLNRVP